MPNNSNKRRRQEQEAPAAADNEDCTDDDVDEEGDEELAETPDELTGFVQDGELYLRDNSGIVYSTERDNWNDLVRVGQWDSQLAIATLDPPMVYSQPPISELSDAEVKARTRELTEQIGAFAQKKQLQRSIETFGQLLSEGLRPDSYT